MPCGCWQMSELCTDVLFQIGVQFNLWDKFKLLDSLGQKQSSHLALFTAHLIANKCLTLAVFKVKIMTNAR